jgi:protein-tyrosine phosphatase
MFVDIHNHILPGVDDGPKDVWTSLLMAERAVENGTQIMVATPHRAYLMRKDAPRPWIIRQTELLQDALISAKIPLILVPGVEIQFGPNVVSDIASGHLCTLGNGGKWALIEPPFNGLPENGLDTIEELAKLKIGVVLAHPERNSNMQRDLKFARQCVKRGCILQLTTGSILGNFGAKALATAEAILSNYKEWPIVIASDSHDPIHRRPNLMAEARNAAAKIVGEAEAATMVDERPRSRLGL